MAVIIETSAIVAIYRKEPDADLFWQVLESGEHLLLPVFCYLESVMVLRAFAALRRWLDELLAEHEIELFGSDGRQAHLAADAFERFGRGSGHPARLNFGDCLAYAAAAALESPLLFKGEDFRLTDVRPALASA